MFRPSFSDLFPAIKSPFVAFARGGKNSGPQHQWSQKFFSSPERMKGRKKKGKREKGEKTKRLKNGNLILHQNPKDTRIF